MFEKRLIIHRRVAKYAEFKNFLSVDMKENNSLRPLRLVKAVALKS